LAPDKPETVGERIIRIAAGRPELPRELKALAELLGVEYETLRKWRAGAVAPNRRRAAVVADVLGVPIETVMHGTPSTAVPTLEPAVALDMALAVVGTALGATPPEHRAELGDLLRQWAQYGGRAMYRELIAELMGRGQRAGALGEMLRPLTPEGLRLARLFDGLPSDADRTLAYARLQALATEADERLHAAADASQHPPAAPPA